MYIEWHDTIGLCHIFTYHRQNPEKSARISADEGYFENKCEHVFLLLRVNRNVGKLLQISINCIFLYCSRISVTIVLAHPVQNMRENTWIEKGSRDSALQSFYLKDHPHLRFLILSELSFLEMKFCSANIFSSGSFVNLMSVALIEPQSKRQPAAVERHVMVRELELLVTFKRWWRERWRELLL